MLFQITFFSYITDQEITTNGIQERHYNGLQKELNKKKPCEDTVKMYLNEEFPQRRRWIVNIGKENRFKIILEKYACFKNPEEVIFLYLIFSFAISYSQVWPVLSYTSAMKHIL